ncbi:MAG: hypothetical protein LBP55_06475 [Candidatus Adiutrix sp.]|jgi:hypothetical protein|nr:hypothetical protein [Candidatus Adiutrix sp.]
MTPGPRKHPAYFLPALIVLGLGLSACGRGPFAPEALRQSAELEHYTQVLQSALVEDKTFEWQTLASALIVRALPYSPRISREAQSRFAGDPTFNTEAGGWERRPSRSSGRPVVILMGVFAPDLAEKDITKLGRFRPRLHTPSGQRLEPLEIKRFGRDAVFVRDHFPVFNPWEEVFLVRFPAPAGGGGAGPLDFKLEWPGGVQTLVLSGD